MQPVLHGEWAVPSGWCCQSGSPAGEESNLHPTCTYNQVYRKSYIDEGFVKSNKHVSEDLELPVDVDNNTKEVSREDEIAKGEDNEQYKEKYFTLKEDHEKILLEHTQLLTKYQQVQKQLDEIKAGKEENRGLKQPNDSNCDLSKGDDVQAKWVDEDGNKSWLSATVTKVLKMMCKYSSTGIRHSVKCQEIVLDKDMEYIDAWSAASKAS